MINRCTRNHPWLTFGCDLVLGTPTDRQATFRESFFLPENVKNAFARAQVLRPNGSRLPLVATERMLLDEIPDDEPARSPFTPLTCSLLILATVLALTLYERRRKRRFRALDCLLFSSAAVAGCVLFFLCFFSTHPGIWPNLSVLWLHPFHFAGVVLCAVKKQHRATYCFHFINFAALLLVCVGWIILPQCPNMAFIPLILCLMIRSGYGIVAKKKTVG
jgi:lipopolysaccharide export LptBFGC system permease protein LptF